VLLDTLHLRNGCLKPLEYLAFVLHEIGHVVNPPNGYQMDGKSGELCADYARHCGLGEPLESCLIRLKTLDPEGFDTELTNERIERINRGVALDLNLISVEVPA
jgi:hypothetical protein